MWVFIRKEFINEWRSLYQLGGLMSFLLGVCFLIYFFSGGAQPRLWNLMFWIVYLFLSFFTAARIYEEDNTKYRIYIYQLADPILLFASKAIYLTLLLTALGLLLNLVLNILIPMNNAFNLLWILLLVLVSLGFAILTCFTSFISSHGQSKQVLMVVITLPLCFPLMGMAFSFADSLLLAENSRVLLDKAYPIVAIDLLAIALVVILLPLSWKN